MIPKGVKNDAPNDHSVNQSASHPASQSASLSVTQSIIQSVVGGATQIHCSRGATLCNHSTLVIKLSGKPSSTSIKIMDALNNYMDT